MTERLPERQANTTRLPPGSGSADGIELRHRHVDGFGIALDVGFVRFAHIDQQDRALGEALGDFLRIKVRARCRAEAP